MRYFCFVHNITDQLGDGVTAYKKRFGANFAGPLYPFGCEVEYKPSSPKMQNQMHPFGNKTLPGLFLGYHQHPGGMYSGDMFLVDWEDLAKAERASDVPIRRIKEKKSFQK